MVPQKCLYFLRRFFQMGPKTAFWLIGHRLKKRLFIKRWKRKWLNGFTYHSWQALQKLYSNQSFEHFFKTLAAKNITGTILADQEFIHNLPLDLSDTPVIISNADKACLPDVKILGYGTFNFAGEPIPWHHDFTKQAKSPDAWATQFFSEVTIPNLQTHSQAALYPDIKVPWELSRFHHFFALGLGNMHAQKHENQALQKKYAHAFVTQADDWMQSNPFLQGVNWVNPMEVAIRAINFVWAFDFFKDSPHIPLSFWQRFVCMLHDHALYLNNTWEVSQKPNNHYIADLLGHLYLSIFLGNTQQTQQTVKMLIGQWQHQILPDQTSYEGSTRYHQLVTEMMMHFVLLCKHANISLPSQVHEQYIGMKNFVADCADIKIGDDDSGKIVAGIKITHNSVAKTYPDFGVSIIATSGWHVTFRHPTYQPHQPSGHFHQDALSITLTLDGIPILVDPGTYVYTANTAWRNNLRSYAWHNIFYHDAPHPLPSDLFQLSCQAHGQAKGLVVDNQQNISVQDRHTYFSEHGLIAHRKLVVSPNNHTLTLADWWEKIMMEPSKKMVPSVWNFHFAPEIVLTKHNDATWHILKSEKLLASLTSTLAFTAHQGWVSSEYGSITPGTTLSASYPHTDDVQSIVIKKLCV